MTTDNLCFYLQNRLIQTSQTGGQWYSDTSPFSIPCKIYGSVSDEETSCHHQHLVVGKEQVGDSVRSYFSLPDRPPGRKLPVAAQEEAVLKWSWINIGSLSFSGRTFTITKLQITNNSFCSTFTRFCNPLRCISVSLQARNILREPTYILFTNSIWRITCYSSFTFSFYGISLVAIFSQHQHYTHYKHYKTYMAVIYECS